MPFMAKQGNNYEEVETLVDTEGREIDYVLSKVGNTYKRTFTKVRELEDAPPLEFKSIKPQANLLDYRIYGNTVDGESVGDRTGNLFDKNGVWVNGYINDNGELAKNNDIATYTEFINVKPDTDYSLICDSSVPEGVRFNYYDSSKNFISRVFRNMGNPKVTTPSTCEYITLSVNKNQIRYLMIIEGSTAPTEYEPYGYKVPVTVEGKNLFDGTVKNGNYTTNFSATNRVRGLSSTIINIGNTITISNYSNINLDISFCIVNENGKNQIDNDELLSFSNRLYDSDWQNKSFTYTSEYSGWLYLLFKGHTTTITKEDVTNIMLNVGSTALPYEPYQTPITTNIYLPEQIKKVGDEAEYIDYSEQKQHRVRKNLLQNTATSQTINNVTFTVNSDGSVTCNGTASTTVLYIISSEAFSLPVGRYKLNGAPTGGGTNYNFKLDVRVSTNTYYPDTGNGIRFNILQGELITKCRLVIYSGYTCNNLTFYPMIRKADIEDDTYEPYITDTELDVTLPALPTVTGTNVLSVGTEVQPSAMYIKGNIKGGGAA